MYRTHRCSVHVASYVSIYGYGTVMDLSLSGEFICEGAIYGESLINLLNWIWWVRIENGGGRVFNRTEEKR